MRLKIAALFEFEGKTPPTNATDLVSITPLVLKQFGFLPQPVMVTVEGDEVVIQYPEEATAAQAEAARLAERAGKRAAEGNYEKAIGILKRALELQPSLHKARRDLAMAYVETGDIDNATNHLIEVLRLDPGDASSWVVLANLYIREKSDQETGEKFLRKALEIAPNDAWALNSLAAVCHKCGKTDEAISLFEHAIQSNPEFANAYYGEALAFDSAQKPDAALETLHRMFTQAKMQDARSKPVYDGARQLFGKLQVDLAQRNESETFKLVQNYKAGMEKLSGYPIRIQEENFESKIGATIQMAWKHKRDLHLLKIRSAYPPPLVSHLESHELTHLKLEAEARKVGKNLFFTTTARSRDTAIRSFAGDIRKWEKAGYSEQKVTGLTLTLVNGLCEFLFNCPLDMLIERHLRATFKPQTAMLTMLHFARAAGELGCIGKFHVANGFQRRQIFIRLGRFFVGDFARAALDKERFLAIRRKIRRGFARNENRGVNGRVKRIALADDVEAVRLQHDTHPRLACQREKRIGNNEAKAPAGAEQLKTQIGEVNVKVFQVIREESLTRQAELESNLRKRIFDVLEDLANGFRDYSANEITKKDFPALYDNSLIFLYRLLFGLYAESRGLLPVKPSGYGSSKIYREKFSLARLVKTLRDKNEFPSEAFTGLYDELLKLFRLISSRAVRTLARRAQAGFL
jgi:tetratricopeptide (TPR) repeat protein